MISIDVIQRSAQMLLPDLDGCYWVISIHENTQQEEARKQMSPERPLRVQEDVMTDDTEKTLARELQHNASREQQREIQILVQIQREERQLSRDSVTEQLQRTEREIVREKEIGE